MNAVLYLLYRDRFFIFCSIIWYWYYCTFWYYYWHFITLNLPLSTRTKIPANVNANYHKKDNKCVNLSQLHLFLSP